MTKKLADMTLEELWTLFPIQLTAHQDVWACWYQEELCALQAVQRAFPAVRLYHIGSTAVPGIWAKPIVDILMEAPLEYDLDQVAAHIMAGGYTCMSRDEQRISLNKGYTEAGFAERVFHLHLRHSGDCDELYFRDYLREHPQAAREYERLKLRLWNVYEHDRDGYTAAKGELVKKYTAEAKRLYGGRYDSLLSK